MKNKKMLAMLLALTVTAAGTPVYAADFSDGNLESVQEVAEPEKILTGDTALEEDSNAQENQESDESGVTSAEETDEFTEEDVASAFTDDTENEVAEAQSSDTESGSEEVTGTEGLEYEYDAETDTYHLVKGVNVESVIIPEQYNGKIVSEIGEKAFAGCDRIKNVRVNRDWDQETMIIRQSAFEGCIHLRKVMLNRVIKVEKNAFRNCPQLSECVYISIDNLFIDGGEFIERDAFDPDNKVCVYLGEESNNFKGNKQYFVAGLFDEDYVFKESGVTYVCYDPNMTGDMEGISREHEGTRILDVQDELETVFVKDTNVTGVGRKAFYGSEKIKVVKLGSQNRYIETKAFFDCENLERVYIPDTTNDIADDAFDGCNSLVIYTPKGSYAEKFARKHNIPVVVSATSQDILNDVKPNLRVTKKEKETCRVVVNGAGSAGVAITKLLLNYGFKDITMCDINGIISKDSENLNWMQKEMAKVTNLKNASGTLADALKGADIFVGVSAPGIVTKDMVASMNKDAILFAMANPVPEIMPDLAKAAGAKVVGTGRSDFPNQVNNVVAFPGIFKGALEGRASQITEEMKLAAAKAIAGLVPDEELSEDNILPQAFDPCVAETVSRAIKELI